MSSMFQKLAEYGNLVAQGLLIILGGMIAVIVLYRLVASVIRPEATWARLLKVAFGALYVLILVITLLLAAHRLGYDVSGIAGIAILTVLAGATLVFFLIPFLPRLPFKPGDVIEVRGVTGVVEAITAYQTIVHTFDGQTVYLPSPLVLASPIVNYSHQPARRVALNLTLAPDSDLDRATELLLQILREHEATLAEPPPAVLVTGVDSLGTSLLASCWVATPAWLGSCDTLWRAALTAFAATPKVSLATPRLQLQEAGERS
jgi:small conductance mechanosensitive channel